MSVSQIKSCIFEERVPFANRHPISSDNPLFSWEIISGKRKVSPCHLTACFKCAFLVSSAVRYHFANHKVIWLKWGVQQVGSDGALVEKFAYLQEGDRVCVELLGCLYPSSKQIQNAFTAPPLDSILARISKGEREGFNSYSDEELTYLLGFPHLYEAGQAYKSLIGTVIQRKIQISSENWQQAILKSLPAAADQDPENDGRVVKVEAGNQVEKFSKFDGKVEILSALFEAVNKLKIALPESLWVNALLHVVPHSSVYNVSKNTRVSAPGNHQMLDLLLSEMARRDARLSLKDFSSILLISAENPSIEDTWHFTE